MKSIYYIMKNENILDVMIDNPFAAEITLDLLHKKHGEDNISILNQTYYGNRSKDDINIITTITLGGIPFISIVNSPTISDFFIEKYTKDNNNYEVKMFLI